MKRINGRYTNKGLLYIPTFILVGTIIFCIFNYSALKKWLGYNLAGKVRVVSVQETKQKEKNAQLAEHQPDRLQIPRINVDAPVIYNSGITEAEIVDNLNAGVVFYNNSSLPDEDGLTVYFGHSSNHWWRRGQYDTVFSLIPELESGDEAVIHFRNQRYIYHVTGKEIINQKNWTKLNNPQIKNGLALVTCWPLGTAWRRYVVWAEKIPNQTP